MDGASVVIREFDPDLDQAFVYASWRNALFYGAEKRFKGSKDEEREEFRRLTNEIRETIRYGLVKIACLEDDPSTIIGYVVFVKNNLEWVYVKGSTDGEASFRRKGIARLLAESEDFDTMSIPLTKIGRAIVEKKQRAYEAQGEANEEEGS